MLLDTFSWGDTVGNLHFIQKLCIYIHNTKYTKIKARLIKYAKTKIIILNSRLLTIFSTACSSPPEGKHSGNASTTQLNGYLLLITTIRKYHKYLFIIKGKNPVQQKKHLC